MINIHDLLMNMHQSRRCDYDYDN